LNGVQFLDEIVHTVGQSAARRVPKHQRVIEELGIKPLTLHDQMTTT